MPLFLFGPAVDASLPYIEIVDCRVVRTIFLAFVCCIATAAGSFTALC
jgi:hypothetical protein